MLKAYLHFNPKYPDWGPLGPRAHSTRYIFFPKETFVMDFNQFVRKFVIYETLKAELDYLNQLFYYSMKRVGVPGDPRAKMTIFLIWQNVKKYLEEF